MIGRRQAALTALCVLCATGMGLPGTASAQPASEFVFTDDEGHLVLRFVGVAPNALTADQREEILNSELSTMVHDRLRADVLFESETVDAHWAHALEPQIEQFIRTHTTEFFAVEAECRSASCRLMLDHEGAWNLSAHERLVPVAQDVINAFIANHEHSIEPEFLIAAHFQEPERPFIKVYVRRAAH